MLALTCGFLATPLLCDAGVAVHQCVCDSTECCADEDACELDACGFLYMRDDWNFQAPINLGAMDTLLVDGLETPTDVPEPTDPPAHAIDNRPFPASELPQRI